MICAERETEDYQDFPRVEKLVKSLKRAEVYAESLKKLNCDFNKQAEILAKLRAQINRIQMETAAAQLYEEVLPDKLKASRKCVSDDLEMEAVHGFFKAGRIFLKCRMLPTTRGFRKLNGEIFPTENISNCSESAIAVMMETILQRNIHNRLFNIEQFRTKTLHFLYCFRNPNEVLMPDATNHYTAKLQNAVTFLLPGGDGGIGTMVAYENTSTELIPEGTYITVSPYNLGIPKTEEVLDVWQEYFAGLAYR